MARLDVGTDGLESYGVFGDRLEGGSVAADGARPQPARLGGWLVVDLTNGGYTSATMMMPARRAALTASPLFDAPSFL
jgi:hypothetical protein